MSGGSKQSGSQTSTTKSEPWSGQQPYLTDVFGKAQDQFNSSNPSYYPGSTIAGQSAATMQGQQGALSAAGNGQGLVNNATGVANATLRGDYLSPDSNPFLKATFDKAAGDVARVYQTATAPGTDAAAIAAGRYNPAGALGFARESNARTLGDNLNNLATSIYGGNYQNERQNQLAAAANAGNIYNNSLLPSQTASQVGQQMDTRAQDVLNSDIDRWNYNQNLGANKLQQYASLVSGNYGGTATTTTPTYSNPFGSILGGGTALTGLLKK